MGDAHEQEQVATAAPTDAAERPLLRGAPSSADGVLALQRMIGNAGVNRLVAARPARTVARLVEDPTAPGITFANPDLQKVFNDREPVHPHDLGVHDRLDQEGRDLTAVRPAAR